MLNWMGSDAVYNALYGVVVYVPLSGFFPLQTMASISKHYYHHYTSNSIPLGQEMSDKTRNEWQFNPYY